MTTRDEEYIADMGICWQELKEIGDRAIKHVNKAPWFPEPTSVWVRAWMDLADAANALVAMKRSLSTPNAEKEGMVHGP